MGNILTFKIGFIGSGSISRAHIIAAQSVGFTTIGICARDFSESARKLSTEFEGLKYHNTLDSFLETKFDGICILLNTDVSLQIYKKVITKQDIPILIEKPVTQSSVFLSKNIDLDRKNTLVGYNRRFYSSVSEIKNYLQQNQNIQSHWNIPEISWDKNPAASARKHFLLENSVHILDLFLYLLGSPSDSIYFNNNENGFLQYSTSVHRFPNGNVASLNLNFGTPDNTSVSFYGPGSYFLLKPIELVSKYSKIITEPANAVIPFKRYIPSQENTWEISQSDIKYKPGFHTQYLEFMEMCTGNSRKIGASLRDAFNVLKFAEKILVPPVYK